MKNMTKSNNSLIKYREQLANDDFCVEFAIEPYELTSSLSEEQRKIFDAIKSIEAEQNYIDTRIDELNLEIDRLTNHADNADYMLSVGVGVLSALIDSFFVGEFDFANAKTNSHRQINNFIMKYAKMNGYKENRLDGAIAFLEKRFPVLQDNIWKGGGIGVGTKNHHLADLAHHPTPLGLLASVIVQFFRLGLFVNKDGEWKITFVSTDAKDLFKIWSPIVISGVLLWLINVAESKYKDEIDRKIPKPIQKIIKLLAASPAIISILKAVINWAGHLVSDMGGSKNTAGGGMGIPGLFVSLLHELSSLPLLKETDLPRYVNDLYTKEKFDLRSEFAVIKELGRQSIPVLLGDMLVRTFYFVRHIILEYNKNNNFKDINWNNVVPLNNRTIARMIMIESGVFTALDLADAAIRSGIKNGPPNNPLFWKDVILHVNFVGIGKFAIAVGTDICMGINREKAVKERLILINKQLTLQNAKVFYLQENMWLEAKNTYEAFVSLSDTANRTSEFLNEQYDFLIKNCKDFKENKSPENSDIYDEISNILN